MPRKSKKKPSFFKVLCHMDFTKLLRLPPAFLSKYDLDLPETVNLRVHSGRRWSVKVERMRNGLLCFTRGWQKFAEEAALQLGEFIFFYLVGKSEFDVLIYDTGLCLREINLPHSAGSNGKRANARNDVVAGRSICRKDGSPKESNDPLYFQICLKKHQRSRISLGKEFRKAAGMEERDEVRMEYVGKPQHSVCVAVDPRPEGYRVDLAKGWAQFRETNRLAYGKVYSFEFDPNMDVIYVDRVKTQK